MENLQIIVDLPQYTYVICALNMKNGEVKYYCVQVSASCIVTYSVIIYNRFVAFPVRPKANCRD